jgi:bla regulator protein blaR1
MNALLKFFDSNWLQTLAGTLLHSLWQGLLIIGFVAIILRFIPSTQSNLRYGVASIGLLLVILASIVTFTYLYLPVTGTIATNTIQIGSPNNQGITEPAIAVYLAQAKSYLQSIVPVFAMVWTAGFTFFLLRIFSGLVYIDKLKGQAVPIQNEWSDYIQSLVVKLKINRAVRLAESALIQTPVVFGYLKPMILIPIGLCSALSTQQLETIFLHEMMHIRRKDYVVNLIQTFVEAIYFFNPFVWIISGIIRQEREHCCDDAVVQLHGSANEYVRALAALEETRLTKVGLSLSFAENKNQLLIRIKRIMEKSVKNYSGRERIVPALLLAIGLVCASWITNRTYEGESMTSLQSVVGDTTKKVRQTKKTTAAAKTKKSDRNKKQEQQPSSDKKAAYPEIPEEFETDYAKGFSQSVFPNPPVDSYLPLPGLPLGAIMPPQLSLQLEDFNGLGVPRSHDGDWEKFAEEFEKNFKVKFEDFYEKHGEEIQQMITDVQKKLNSDFGDEWEDKMEDLAAKQQEWATEQAKRWEQHAEKFSRWEEGHLKEFEKNHEKFEMQMRAFEENSKRFEEELKKELIKDGYLQEDEKLETIHWRNGKIEINGKSIKPADEKKYNDLHKKYFSGHDNDGPSD